MRVLFLGDIVGRDARNLIIERMGDIRAELALDFVVVNCENAAAGYGITAELSDQLLECGIDVLTTGNHVWDQKGGIFNYIDAQPRLIRPVNMSETHFGAGVARVSDANGKRLVVINVMGNVMMRNTDPMFPAVNDALVRNRLGRDADFILVDVHAETTSEKTAMGHYVDGRASLVVGTHTHVPTADHRILEGGTAYLTDVGMCGNYDSVIGMKKEQAIHRFLTEEKVRFEVARGEPSLSGVLVESDEAGRAVDIRPFRQGGLLEPTWPGQGKGPSRPLVPTKPKGGKSPAGTG